MTNEKPTDQPREGALPSPEELERLVAAWQLETRNEDDQIRLMRLAPALARAYLDSQAALTTATEERERLREALERIGWHELTWKEARDAARQALNTTKGGEDDAG